MVVFITLYVWQNIEVMKLKMDYRRGMRIERQLMVKSERLRTVMELARRTDAVEKYAAERGMKRATPRDIEVIDLGMKKK